MNDACAVDVTPSRPETDMSLSLDIVKPALSSDASVGDLSVQLVSRSPTPAGGINRLASDESTATMSRVSPTLSLSEAVCPQSLSPAGRVSTNPTELSDREDNKPELQTPAISVDESGDFHSSTLSMKSNCFDTCCTSSISNDVIHQADDEVRVPYSGRSLTEPVMTPRSSAVDLHRITEQVVGDCEVDKIPVNLKLNGAVQLDEGPLDLSVGRHDKVARSRRSNNVSVGVRPRSSKSQSLTSTSLARLVKRFGITSTSTTTSMCSTSSVDGSGGGSGRFAGTVSQDVLPPENSTRPRSVAVSQSSSLFNPLRTSGNLIASSERPNVTFGAPQPSRWRRDSFWANGGWLSGATVASSSSSTAERVDNRRRSRPVATTDSSSMDCRSHVTDAPPIKLNRKQFSDQRKSSRRGSTRLRCDRKFSCSRYSDSASRAAKVSSLAQETNAVSHIDNAATPTSPKVPRTATLKSEPDDAEKKKRQDADGGDILAATPTPVRSNLTSLRCGSCGAQFDSLYCLTVHLEETGHKPASDVAVLPMPSPAASPSSTDRKLTVVSPAISATTPPLSAPQRLVRGQDVWLARGVEQTDRILRCIQCNAPARSLAELTLHMVHTKHYINIVGPTTASTPKIVGCDNHQRTALQLPPTLRDKSSDPAALKAKSGLRTTSCKDHELINTRTRYRDRYDGARANIADGDRTVSQQASNLIQDSVDRKLGTHKNANKGTVKNTNSVQKESSDAVVDGKVRTTERGAGAVFSVRNLIASDMDSDSVCSSPQSAADLRLPLTIPSLSPRSRRHDGRSMTSSIAPEVTSSSDKRRSPVTVAEPVSGHDVIPA